MELHYSFEDGVYSGCSSISESMYGGIIDKIEFTIPSMPESGLNLYHVPAGTYTLQYREIPDGYTAPKTTKFTVEESDAPQYLELVLGGGILYGDVDRNGSINAADAALLLKAASAVGSGGASGLTQEQETAADVNRDGTFDAVDAALILQYAAYLGSGGTQTMMGFLAERVEA
ncbi:MAG: dockerin type I repeat-containing protein [Oscillospiraceae bacterium]|nr:dockerin type I repeat-containing protein [Oscillospiraceae bacterium]